MIQHVKFALPLFSVLASCGSIMRPGPEMVPISSEPPGAIVRYAGAQVGVTPCSVPMKGRISQFELERDGFHKQLGEAGVSANGWVFGNVFFGFVGLVGIMIDLAGNKTSVVNDDPIHIILTPLSDPAPQPWSRPKPKTTEYQESASSSPT